MAEPQDSSVQYNKADEMLMNPFISKAECLYPNVYFPDCPYRQLEILLEEYNLLNLYPLLESYGIDLIKFSTLNIKYLRKISSSPYINYAANLITILPNEGSYLAYTTAMKVLEDDDN